MSMSLPPPPQVWPGVPSPAPRLVELARELGDGVRVEGDAQVRIYGVRHDSRRVQEGDLFYARRGRTSDGLRFAEDAVASGARAVLAGEGQLRAADLGVPVLVATDPARAFARMADAVYGHPSFSLETVGVTGTNGKTTVSHLVRDAIDGALGLPRCGLVGTVGHSFAGFALEAEHTTPEADEIARVLAAFRHRGATHVAMEVSSIALALGRVDAVRFRVAVFTNLTQDHLDFHGSMAAYGEAKASLFEAHGPGAAVVHVDDAFGNDLARRVRAPLLRVSSKVGAGGADVFPTAVSDGGEGIALEVSTPAGPVAFRSPLRGGHNVDNLLLALATALALELDVARAAAALAASRGAPGRLERCDEPGDGVQVLVDYAHTPDAIAKVVRAARGFTAGRVIVVFGCGGDRDPHKRGPMGRAAAAGDVIIVTSDNPRSEEPARIAAEAAEGVAAAGKVPVEARDVAGAASAYATVLDRRDAIRIAVSAARAGDTVLILGKGHEPYQIVGGTRLPFDDRAEARAALAIRRGGGATGG